MQPTLFKFIAFAICIYCSAAGVILQNKTPQWNNKDWYEVATFYQIYPRSFKDSDGDGIGDIQGIISKLDYLADLGITATWLSPIFKSPMADFGYDIADFYDIDPMFGTMSDLEELFQKADHLGIKIILDFVPNHSSDQCEWFQQSILRNPEYDEFYIWHNGTEPIDENGIPSLPNNWKSVFRGPAWTWNPVRGQYYFHQFAKEQPDLNYRNQQVVDEMSKVLIFWLDKGAYGFRVDAINHMFEYEDLRDEPRNEEVNDPDAYDYTLKHYTKDLNETYDIIYSWRELLDDFTAHNGGQSRIMMTEAYANTTWTMKYYQSDDGLRQGSQMPFNFVLISELSSNSSASDFLQVIIERLDAIPEGKVTNWVIGNHDNARVASRYPDREDALLVLVMTLPGIAVTYMGEEIGMLDNRDGITFEQTVDPQGCNAGPDEFRKFSRDPVRTPFQWDDTKWAGFSDASDAVEPWLPVNPNYHWLNLKNQQKSDQSYYKLYKQLIQLRQNPVFVNGNFQPIVINENVLIYTRSLNERNDNAYIILINLVNLEERVRITDILNTTSKNNKSMKVVLSGANSCHRNGEILRNDEIILRKYDALILTGISSTMASINVTLITVAVILVWISYYKKLNHK